MNTRTLATPPRDPAHAVNREPIGVTLERDRLAHRAWRLELAILALQRIADTRTTNTSTIPEPLRNAMHAFSLELHEVKRRLTRDGETAGVTKPPKRRSSSATPA
jgi:hypothetical protein